MMLKTSSMSPKSGGMLGKWKPQVRRDSVGLGGHLRTSITQVRTTMAACRRINSVTSQRLRGKCREVERHWCWTDALSPSSLCVSHTAADVLWSQRCAFNQGVLMTSCGHRSDSEDSSLSVRHLVILSPSSMLAGTSTSSCSLTVGSVEALDFTETRQQQLRAKTDRNANRSIVNNVWSTAHCEHT